MRCIECENVSIKPHPSHAKHGLGRCLKEEFATFYDLGKHRKCDIFIKTNDNTIQKRIKWYENR
jgi:hypothetical protein